VWQVDSGKYGDVKLDGVKWGFAGEFSQGYLHCLLHRCRRERGTERGSAQVVNWSFIWGIGIGCLWVLKYRYLFFDGFLHEWQDQDVIAIFWHKLLFAVLVKNTL
jgi:hypothetical protein